MGMVNRQHVEDRQTAESRVQGQNPRTPTLKSKGQTWSPRGQSRAVLGQWGVLGEQGHGAQEARQKEGFSRSERRGAEAAKASMRGNGKCGHCVHRPGEEPGMGEA